MGFVSYDNIERYLRHIFEINPEGFITADEYFTLRGDIIKIVCLYYSHCFVIKESIDLSHNL